MEASSLTSTNQCLVFLGYRVSPVASVVFGFLFVLTLHWVLAVFARWPSAREMFRKETAQRVSAAAGCLLLV